VQPLSRKKKRKENKKTLFTAHPAANGTMDALR